MLSFGLNFIVLVIWLGRDYYFYCFDKNGYFFYKFGRLFVRNVDNFNNFILDLWICDCGFYIVFKGFFMINIFNVCYFM